MSPAGKENTDVVVIALRGLAGWRHLIFGWVVERFVRLAPCVVFTVKFKKMKCERAERVA